LPINGFNSTSISIKYATKSGKITLAQKNTDELIEQKNEQEQK
jgi:hypothetical protein